MPIALAGLCELLFRARTLRRALSLGWGFGFGQFLIALNWIATAFTFQSNMPAWLGWVGVLLVALYLAIYPALAAGLAWRLGNKRPAAIVLVLAGAWALTEWLRAGLLTGFAWNPAGVVLADTPWLQSSELIGTYGLSILVVLFGGGLWLASLRKFVPAAAVLAVLGLLMVLPTASEPEAKLKPITVVQPNIGQEDKWRAGFSEEAARRLATLSVKKPGDDPRLLFWPEAAVTDPLTDSRIGNPGAFAAFERKRAAATIGAGEFLLTGGIAVNSSDGRRIDGAANSIFVLGPGGKVVARYDKAHLVPFGEYLPLRPLLTPIGLSRLAPGDMDFAPGPGPRTIDLGEGWGKVGMQLCYEIIFSGEVVDRRHRPDVIFNPSNDAWFGRWGPPQHLAQARLRAAEEGIPVIRSTPTGISAVIDAYGNVRQSAPWRTAGALQGQMPSALAPTPFARFGNLIPLLLAFAFLIGGIAMGRTRR
jgi:apolipoprotein N-acyltransferase